MFIKILISFLVIGGSLEFEGIFTQHLFSFLISASPFGEMKVGLPYAILSANLNPWTAFLFCIAGNLLIFPIVEYFIDHQMVKFFRHGKLKRMAARLRSLSRKKTEKLIKKYGFWGLMVFVMVPLPGTGAYLGTVASYVFEFDKKDASLAISIGVVISGLLVQLTCLAGDDLWNYFESLFYSYFNK